MEKKVTLIFSVMLIALLILSNSGCGRKASRLMGKDHRQIVKISNIEAVDDIVCISFDKRGSSTVKDVTFHGTDGYLYTQEFKDVSPLEGIIRWVPATESDSLIQSRAISRWTGGAVNLKLPDDFDEIINVDIGYAGGSERVKNLVYRATSGAVYCKEYREGMIDRHFEGWMEVVKQ